MEEGVVGLLRDKTRPPGRKPLAPAVIAQVLSKTTAERPPNATHWSASQMARAVGISVRSVQRIWDKAKLKPHLTRSVKLSNAPHFEESEPLRVFRRPVWLSHAAMATSSV
jgi:hypothetical protein